MRLVKVPKNDFVDIDFETRSEADLKAVGANRYAAHPSTEILMCSYSINQRRTINWNPYYSNRKKPYALIAQVKAGYYVRAHHSEFEYWIWNLVATRQFGWPEVPIEQFFDTMGQVCAMTLPASLEGAGEALNLNIQKDKEGKRLIGVFSKPSRKQGEKFKDPLVYSDDFRKFMGYCDQDVDSQIALSDNTNRLSTYEFNVLLLTEKMNVRGIPFDRDMVEGALELVNAFQKKADEEAQIIINSSQAYTNDDNRFKSLSQRDRVKKWLNDNDCPVPDMTKETIADFLNGRGPSDIPEDALRILYLRSQFAKTSTSKYIKIRDQLDENDRVHGFIKYHIARTGRWGGRGIQIHNFAKPSDLLPKDIDWEEVAEMISDRDYRTIELMYDDVMEVLSGALRSSICAPDGHKFVSADYSQIEARLAFWFSGDEIGLAEFSGEGKIYEAMASEIYGLPQNKIVKPSKERDVGKQTILGAQFGMGPPRFIKTCWEKASIEIDLDIAEKSIWGYRKKYKSVPQMWKKVESAAINAVLNKGSVFETNRVAYMVYKKHLYCKLPSGRKMVYLFPEIHQKSTRYGIQDYLTYMGIDPYNNKWTRLATWGGKLVENFVQAAARDIMAHGMLVAEERGYPSLFTVHDEALALVRKDFGSYQDYEKILCEIPDWADGCPIVAEGWEGKRYRK